MARLIRNSHILIHVAKTGGTFFREVLNEMGLPNKEVLSKHSSIKQIREAGFDQPAIGFIRNPLSWYKSRWAYGMMTNFELKMKVLPEAAAHWMAPVWSNDLNIFVERTLEKYPYGIATTYFNDMLCLDDPNDMEITICKYENLVEEISWWMTNMWDRPIEHMELKRMTPKLSSTAIGSEISLYNQELIRKVEWKLMAHYYGKV